MTPSRFGLLTTIDSPLLPLFLEYLRLYEVNDLVVICDSKLLSDKDQRIFRDRVGGREIEVRGGVPTLYQGSGTPVPFIFVDNHNSDYTRSAIAELNIDCLVNAGTPRRLGLDLVNSIPLGVVNVHPGILPKYRGSSAVEWSIFNDDPVGNTAHFMSESYDAGPIIRIEQFVFGKDATYQDIRRHVYRQGAELAAKVLNDIQSGNITAETSSIQDPSEAKLWEPIPDACMQAVLDKLAARRYKYQSENIN